MTVSVILCAYNGAKFIRSSIESVLAQNFTDFELLILDDASADESFEIACNYQDKDSRVQVLRNPSNMGTGYGFQVLLARATGKYVAQIGQDDLWSPDFLRQTVHHLEVQLKTGVVFAGVDLIDSKGELTTSPGPFRHEALVGATRHGLATLLFELNFLCAAASLFRREVFESRLNGERNDYLQDWMCWLNFSLLGTFGYVPEKLVKYRIHGDNFSFKVRFPLQQEREIERVRLRFLESPFLAAWLRDAEQPDLLFRQIISTFIKASLATDRLDDSGLLNALQFNEMQLLPLRSFKAAIGLLLWLQGRFAESLKYGKIEDSLTEWPEILPALHKRWLVRFSLTSRKLEVHHFQLRKSNFPFLFPLLTRRDEAPERSLERAYGLAVKGSQSFFLRFIRRFVLVVRSHMGSSD